ncbi:MAG: glycoside hydrolase family 3 protein, partial [Sphingomonadales bacterium]|nr:glycoside hydrolase family 3 protein [Sphingomonadales bacterium]
MPGHGRAACDSHKELPTVTAGETELEIDLAPFRALADAPVAMTGHIRFTAWDAEHPATQSPFVIKEIIRRRIGFRGLLLTDDIDMEALDGSIPERSAKAVAAGCDIVLNCWGRMDDMVGIAKALPAMGPETAGRLERALAGTAVPRLPDPALHAALIAERDALAAPVLATA